MFPNIIPSQLLHVFVYRVLVIIEGSQHALCVHPKHEHHRKRDREQKPNHTIPPVLPVYRHSP